MIVLVMEIDVVAFEIQAIWSVCLLVGFQSINLTSKLFYHVTNSARSPMAERKLCFSSDVLALMSICSLYLKCI
jgi:hypothetical protein